MNTFFYSASVSQCKGLCEYNSCSKRCVSTIKELSTMKNLKVLPAGSNFKTTSCMEMRSGDIIILYAENINDINALITIRDFFETFRIILIVGKESMTQMGQHYLLNPRYTTSIGKNLDELNSVIHRIRALDFEQKPQTTIKRDETCTISFLHHSC